MELDIKLQGSVTNTTTLYNSAQISVNTNGTQTLTPTDGADGQFNFNYTVPSDYRGSIAFQGTLNHPDAGEVTSDACKTTLGFDKLVCGAQGCSNASDCTDGHICTTADNGKKYCAKEEYKEACQDNPNSTTCCQAPDEKLVCGEEGCDNNNDCSGDHVCVEADNGKKYCAKQEYQGRCEDNPSEENCCEPEEEKYECAEYGCKENSDCDGDLVCVKQDGEEKGYCSEEDQDIQESCEDNPTFNNCCELPPSEPELPRAGGVQPTILFTLGGIILVVLGLIF